MFLRHSKMSLLLCLLVAVFVSTAALPMENNATSLSSNIQKDKTTDKPSPNGDNSPLNKNNLGTIKDKSSKTADSSSKIADRSAVHSHKSLNDDLGTMKANSMLNDGSPAVDGEFKCYVDDYNKEPIVARWSCGFSYSLLLSNGVPNCNSVRTAPKSGLYRPRGSDNFARFSQQDGEAKLSCACSGSVCNQMDGLGDCLLKAFEVDMVEDTINKNDTLVEFVRCIIPNATLSNIWKVPQIVVATISTSDCTTASGVSAPAGKEANSTSKSDSPNVVVVAVAASVCSFLVGCALGVGVAILVMRSGKKEAKEEPKRDAKPPPRNQKKSQRAKKSREEKSKSQEDKKSLEDKQSHEESSPATPTSPAKETSTNGRKPAKTTTEPTATTPEASDVDPMEAMFKQMRPDANVSKSTSERKNADKRGVTRIVSKKPKA